MTDQPRPHKLKTSPDPSIPHPRVDLPEGITQVLYKDGLTLTINNLGNGQIELSYVQNYQPPPDEEQPLDQPGGITLTFNAARNTKEPALFDLNKDACTIGASEDNSFQFSDIQGTLTAKRQATLSWEEGQLIYTHHARHSASMVYPDAQLPVASTEQVIMGDDRLSSAGYSHQNPSARPRQEDVGAVLTPSEYASANPLAYLYDLIVKRILPVVAACEHQAGGSTLSIALPTADGKYACAHIGDSPFFLVVRNKNTADITLEQVMLPHTQNGDYIRRWSVFTPNQSLLHMSLNARRLIREAHTHIRENGHTVPPNLDTPKQLNSHRITRNIEKTQPADSPAFYTPDMCIVDPARDLHPDGAQDYLECLGMLVCSDGINPGIGAASQALTALYKKYGSDLPDPAEIAKTAVMAALPWSGDNTTAIMLPRDAKDMAVVADGNLGTAKIAQLVVETLRRQVEIPGPQLGSAQVAGNPSPESIVSPTPPQR